MCKKPKVRTCRARKVLNFLLLLPQLLASKGLHQTPGAANDTIILIMLMVSMLMLSLLLLLLVVTLLHQADGTGSLT